MQLLDDVLLGNTVGTNAIAPWNANLEPTQGIIPQLDADRSLTGIGGTPIYAQSLIPDNSDNIILPDASLSQMTNAVITNSDASLSDSDVDLLIGQAMSEVHGDLSKFAVGPDFVDGINLAFGENWDAAGAKALAEGWYKGDFSDNPSVKVVSSAEIAGANGAFAEATDTIYLSRELVAGGNLTAVADVLLEEIGHSVDARLNVTDSPGDEGAIFAAVVQGKELSQGELQGLKSEDDRQVVAIDGHEYLVEKQLNDGNDTLNTASSLGIGAWFQENGVDSTNRSSSIGGSDLNDYYTFSLNNTSQVDLTLKGLQADADLQLLDTNGTVIQSSTNGSTSDESLTRTLNAGQYFIRVYPYLNAITNYNLNLAITTLHTQVPANNWKAEYFNNTNLTGNPVFVENLGDGSQGFFKNWGNGSPSNTPSDNFSARITTQRYLAPGLYQITTQADDGIRVQIKNQTVVDQWTYKSFATNSGYFRSNGETVPIAVDYSELGGGAALNFNIIPATKFRDSVDYTQQWKATVYSWNSSQGSAPPTNFWEGDINSPNAIGEINLGSNTRSDGKKGINANWGTGAPNGDGNRLPHDFFAMRAYTQANFDGSSYKFRVEGDDGFQLLARNQSTGEWFNITSPNQWTQSYSAKEINYQLPAGQYDMHFHQYEGGGDARFDLSWEKIGNPKLDIQLVYPYGGFTAPQRAIFEQAATNWENVITKDKVPSGVLKIALTQGSRDILGNNWASDIAAQTYSALPEEPPNTRYDFTSNLDGQNQTHFNSAYINGFSRNNLIRLTMHEMGHALGLDEARPGNGLFDTAGNSLMDLRTPAQGGQDQTITEGMNKKLEYFGYGVNRNPSINWY
jgi:hypothetical protein